MSSYDNIESPDSDGNRQLSVESADHVTGDSDYEDLPPVTGDDDLTDTSSSGK